MTNESYFIGVDVGTGSCRAAIVNDKGIVINVSTCLIKTWNPAPGYYEQSSNDIWESCCKVIQDVSSEYPPHQIKGIGFDATCSLVVIGKNDKPISVSPTGNVEQNVILWMDHRAFKETEFINSLKHPVLKYVGEKISLEMETPKLLWLKNNLREQCWDKVELFFDLPDFLTWKATGSETRSLCSLVCKWTYEISSDNNHGWNESYFHQIGLEDLLKDNSRKIGNIVLAPATACGNGLTENVAKTLGLLPGTPVGTSIIDAHAGGLGMIGCSAKGVSNNFGTRLGLICGTSTCHMAIKKEPIFAPGVWGPYFNAMVPGYWLNEGGQSATGKLIDHMIETHPAYTKIKNEIGDIHIQQYLSKLLSEIAKSRKLKYIDLLTEKIHIWPDFHGNRSPLADSTLRGMISGLSLSTEKEDLAILYLATVQALAYGTKHILEKLQLNGYNNIDSILICGGLSKNPIFIQTQANVVGLPVLCPKEQESVLIGAAILGACASNHFQTVNDAIISMGGEANVVWPELEIHNFHCLKYNVFLKMVEDQKKYIDLMKQ